MLHSPKRLSGRAILVHPTRGHNTPERHVSQAWASPKSITGYPASTTFRANQLLAGQDPVALDVCAAKHVLYPIDNNDRHHPDFPGINAWLVQARDMINGRGGLRQAEPLVGVDNVTRDEAEINLVRDSAARYIREGPLRPEEPASKIKKGSKPR